MPRLPALCGECGAVYPAPVRAERPGSDNAFPLPAPCPGCGGSGRVPGESLGRVAAMLDALGSVEADEEAWRELRELLVELSEDPPERRELSGVLARRAPAFRRVAGTAPALEGRALGAWLELAALAAGFVRDRPPNSGGVEPPRTPASPASALERFLEMAYDRMAPDPGPDELSEAERGARRRLGAVGRNDPCPCGSGKKYKACHWREDLAVTRG